MVNALLGSHKPSAEWYTPEDIWQRVRGTYGTQQDWIYDPCPIGGDLGLDVDWKKSGKNIYVNPPTPAAPWALKAIQTHLEHPEINIIFACFSEAVLWQVNDLLDYPTCWVRNRISWIDGNQWVRCSDLEPDNNWLYNQLRDNPDDYKIISDRWFRRNPNYLKPAKSPRNYNAFVCLSENRDIIRRFCENFETLGTIRQTYDMSIG